MSDLSLPNVETNQTVSNIFNIISILKSNFADLEEEKYEQINLKINIYFTNFINKVKMKFIESIRKYKEIIKQNEKDILQLMVENMLLKIENAEFNKIKYPDSTQNTITKPELEKNRNSNNIYHIKNEKEIFKFRINNKKVKKKNCCSYDNGKDQIDYYKNFINQNNPNDKNIIKIALLNINKRFSLHNEHEDKISPNNKFINNVYYRRLNKKSILTKSYKNLKRNLIYYKNLSLNHIITKSKNNTIQNLNNIIYKKKDFKKLCIPQEKLNEINFKSQPSLINSRNHKISNNFQLSESNSKLHPLFNNNFS